MLKLIPLILIPFCFFIIFLGVKNLTDNFQLSIEDKTEEISTIKVEKEAIKNLYDEEKVEKNKEHTQENSDKDKVEKNKEHPQENNHKENLTVKSINKLKEDLKKDVQEKKESSSNNLTQKEMAKKNPTEELKRNERQLSLQFGAFSKKNNAISLKKSVEKTLKPKFPSFTIETYFDEKTKLFKLLYTTIDENLAKNICNFCKKNKINCLIK